MAYWDERSGERPRLPPLPAIAPSEHGASGVGRLVRSQDLESADSRKVVKCAASALLPPSDSPPPQPRRNSEGVVIPLPLPCLRSIDLKLTKYPSKAQQPRVF